MVMEETNVNLVFTFVRFLGTLGGPGLGERLQAVLQDREQVLSRQQTADDAHHQQTAYLF